MDGDEYSSDTDYAPRSPALSPRERSPEREEGEENRELGEEWEEGEDHDGEEGVDREREQEMDRDREEGGNRDREEEEDHFREGEDDRYVEGDPRDEIAGLRGELERVNTENRYLVFTNGRQERLLRETQESLERCQNDLRDRDTTIKLKDEEIRKMNIMLQGRARVTERRSQKASQNRGNFNVRTTGGVMTATAAATTNSGRSTPVGGAIASTSMGLAASTSMGATASTSKGQIGSTSNATEFTRSSYNDHINVTEDPNLPKRNSHGYSLNSDTEETENGPADKE